ncbi:MAG: thiamine-phosphate kinase [Thermodesulfobacteriota bacterium]
MKERALIRDIRSGRQAIGGLIRGIGDDCAVFQAPAGDRVLLMTSDTLVDGVHFNRDFHPAESLGRKCVSVNLSDIAAMGALPCYALLCLSLPNDLPRKWLDQWRHGFDTQLDAFSCALIGGDTTVGRDLVVTVTIVGAAPEGDILYRNRAQKNDLVCVSGPLGSAAAGLSLLQKGVREQAGGGDKKFNRLFKAHLDPEPLVRLGCFLGQSGLAHAMQDISDGLATDLAHICTESGVGAVIEEQFLPCDPQLPVAADQLGVNRLDWMLRGGEDYQLLAAVAPEQIDSLNRALEENGFSPLIVIGRLTEEEGVFLHLSSGRREEISFQGYEHSSGD